jgi:cysteine-rich repeat protein
MILGMRCISQSMGVAVLLVGTLANGCNSRSVGIDETHDACCGADHPVLALCGNGVTEPPEQCDDGNTVGGDGCDETCRIDNCVASPEVCNGEDDDCDGVADNGGVCACTDPLALTIVHTQTVAGPGSAADVSLVWNGTEYGAVWTGGFARLDAGGRILENPPSVTFMGSAPADVVYSNSVDRYIFCWNSMEDVYCGQRGAGMTETDVALAVSRNPPEASFNNPRSAYNDTANQLAVVYPTGMFSSYLYNLVLLDTSYATVAGPVDAAEHGGYEIMASSLIWTGEHYAFVYLAADETLYLSLFSGAGARLGPDIPVAELDFVEYFGNLTWDGSSFRFAWSDFGELFYLKFSPTGQIEAHNQVTQYGGTALVYSPIMALGPWPGLVWFDLDGSLDGPNRAYFTVTDDDGHPLREPILLSGHGIYPWIASNGETYLVGWREGEDVWDPEIAFATIGCP